MTQSIVTVNVVVQENGIQVADFDIAYFAGQPYTVALITPDGTDNEIRLVAGDSGLRVSPEKEPTA